MEPNPSFLVILLRYAGSQLKTQGCQLWCSKPCNAFFSQTWSPSLYLSESCSSHVKGPRQSREPPLASVNPTTPHPTPPHPGPSPYIPTHYQNTTPFGIPRKPVFPQFLHGFSMRNLGNIVGRGWGRLLLLLLLLLLLPPLLLTTTPFTPPRRVWGQMLGKIR